MHIGATITAERTPPPSVLWHILTKRSKAKEHRRRRPSAAFGCSAELEARGWGAAGAKGQAFGSGPPAGTAELGPPAAGLRVGRQGGWQHLRRAADDPTRQLKAVRFDRRCSRQAGLNRSTRGVSGRYDRRLPALRVLARRRCPHSP